MVSASEMLKDQIESRGIHSLKILRAMANVQRELFVPDVLKKHAYEDRPLSIGYGQTISQPYIVAYMTDMLELSEKDSILEIGTGSGYQTAILAKICKKVYSVEIKKELAAAAIALFGSLKYDNISVRNSNGYFGWQEFAPYDAIIVTAAPAKIPDELIKQLKTGGKMILPIGEAYQELLLVTRLEKECQLKSLLPVRFVPMINS